MSSLQQAGAAQGFLATTQHEPRTARASLATLPESPDGTHDNHLVPVAEAVEPSPASQPLVMGRTAGSAAEASEPSRKQQHGALAHALSVPLPGKPTDHSRRLQHQLTPAAQPPITNAGSECHNQAPQHEAFPHEALRSLRVPERVDRMSPMMNFGQPVAGARHEGSSLQRMHSQPQTVADMQGRPPQQSMAMPTALPGIVAKLTLPPGDDCGGVTCGVQPDSSDDDELPQDDSGCNPAIQQPSSDDIWNPPSLPSACKQQQPSRAMDVFEDDAQTAGGNESSAAMGAWMHQASSAGKETSRKRMVAKTERQPLASRSKKEQPSPEALGVGTAAARNTSTCPPGRPPAANTMAIGHMAVAGRFAGLAAPDRPSAQPGPAGLPEAEIMQAATAVTSPPAVTASLPEGSGAEMGGSGASPPQMRVGRSMPVPGQAGLMEIMATPTNAPRPSARLRAVQSLHSQKSPPHAANAASHGALAAELQSSQQILSMPDGQQRAPGPLQITAGFQSLAIPSPFAAAACQKAQKGSACGSEGQAPGIPSSSAQIPLGAQQDVHPDHLGARKGKAQQQDGSPEAPDPTSPVETHPQRGAASRPLAARQAAACRDPGLGSAAPRPAAKEVTTKPPAPANKENRPVPDPLQGASPDEGLQADEAQHGAASYQQDQDGPAHRSIPEVIQLLCSGLRSWLAILFDHVCSIKFKVFCCVVLLQASCGSEMMKIWTVLLRFKEPVKPASVPEVQI